MATMAMLDLLLHRVGGVCRPRGAAPRQRAQPEGPRQICSGERVTRPQTGGPDGVRCIGQSTPALVNVPIRKSAQRAASSDGDPEHDHPARQDHLAREAQLAPTRPRLSLAAGSEGPLHGLPGLDRARPCAYAQPLRHAWTGAADLCAVTARTSVHSTIMQRTVVFCHTCWNDLDIAGFAIRGDDGETCQEGIDTICKMGQTS